MLPPPAGTCSEQGEDRLSDIAAVSAQAILDSGEKLTQGILG